ncbi:hypothetical protein [Methylocaldum sp.]|uniref:phage tail tube protein n=1 Tax=Methylocaldum sp. TaxID=1969727 RepID=UPI002D4D3029|nr:hypothetical protein [Methylocaldum sp.]HYE35505.1 hypothetical protein [Methylocaldum sp.]
MPQNIVLGAGKLYFDLEDANGNLTGERYLGDTPGFTVNVQADKLEDYDSDGPIAEKHLDIATRVNRSAQIVGKDISGDNLALFLIGDKSTVNQSSGSVTDEALTVKKGHYYQLGASASRPAGVRDISTVVVTGAGGTPTYVDATDYTVDLTLARLYIESGGAIADDTPLLVDYAKVATTWEEIASNNLGAKKGALRFIADNTQGENRDLYIPKCEMAPGGELAWKSRDTVQQMTFAVSIGKRGSYAQVYVNGRPA